jgi:drug/metabolite transporter (DMT)-like permease
MTVITHSSWFYYTLGLGALFIVVFNLMALTTQRSGLSVVSVATKMSVVIPILFGLFYYKESLGSFNVVGIILALAAVYLASAKSSNAQNTGKSSLILPLLVFVGSGIIDISIKYLEEAFVSEPDVPLFSATIFGAAAAIGMFLLIIQKFQGKFTFELKNVIGGIALGIPNFFSIYFLVKALRSGILESSGIFTVNNVAIVMISTLVGILFFKEKLSLKNWAGIILAIISILLVALAQF